MNLIKRALRNIRGGRSTRRRDVGGINYTRMENAPARVLPFDDCSLCPRLSRRRRRYITDVSLLGARLIIPTMGASAVSRRAADSPAASVALARFFENREKPRRSVSYRRNARAKTRVESTRYSPVPPPSPELRSADPLYREIYGIQCGRTLRLRRRSAERTAREAN